MPRRDGTGPEAKGAMTGRGLGSCETDTIKDGNSCLRPRCGRGLRKGAGSGSVRGMGRGRMLLGREKDAQ